MRLTLFKHRHVFLHGFQMHQIEQCNVGNHGRQKGVLDHLQVGNADIFDHQERGRAHDGRHDLTVDRACHLNGARLFRREAHALHERNGESARRHHIGDGGTRDQAGHHRGQHCRLGRSAAQMTKQREGQLDEEIARARPVQHRAEQHEQEHEGG